MKRVLGVIEGDHNGPLNILLGGLHGNEVAGVKAINQVFQDIRNHRIPINGTLVGLAGNLQAIAANKRFIDYDLNRCWTNQFASAVYAKQHTLAEDIEFKSLHEIILKYNRLDADQKILIDLHTTSSEKGNFIVVPANEASNPVVKSLRQPVVVDLDQHLKGTLLKYLQQFGFLAMAFEGGLIGSSKAIDLHEAGIWEILKASGAVDPSTNTDFLKSQTTLEEYSQRMPAYVRVKYHHQISIDDDFRMAPGYENFQPVVQGQPVAEDKNGVIEAPLDGLMFLPLYQTVGDDGFFIVEEITEESPSI